jgi:hypothetical protein
MKLNESDDYNEWTRRILSFFAELGKYYDYQIYLKPSIGVTDLDNNRTSEYLVDLCWSFEDERDRAFWIELALESELSSQNINSIRYDFQKLTDVKSFIKVGIFGPRLRDKQEVLDMIRILVSQHGIQVSTEKYLVILLIYHGKTETESKRIEVSGYEITYSGDIREIVSTRFPEKLRKTRVAARA